MQIYTTTPEITNAVETIVRWDTDRIGNDVVFHYLTTGMKSDDPCITERVLEENLIQYILDWGHADDREGAESFLLDAFEDMKDEYWDNILHPRLVMSFIEATNYVEAFKAKHVGPLNDSERDYVLGRVKSCYGITLLREAV